MILPEGPGKRRIIEFSNCVSGQTLKQFISFAEKELTRFLANHLGYIAWSVRAKSCCNPGNYLKRIGSPLYFFGKRLAMNTLAAIFF
jgi:hypothetical protein